MERAGGPFAYERYMTMTYFARVIRVQDGWMAGQRVMPTPEIAASHLLMLLRMAGWQGDEDATAARLAEFLPVRYKGYDYRVLRPALLTALEEEMRKIGEEGQEAP